MQRLEKVNRKILNVFCSAHTPQSNCNRGVHVYRLGLQHNHTSYKYLNHPAILQDSAFKQWAQTLNLLTFLVISLSESLSRYDGIQKRVHAI
eukprot:1151717-Pelagomonas_calceolata.AAC.4